MGGAMAVLVPSLIRWLVPALQVVRALVLVLGVVLAVAVAVAGAVALVLVLVLVALDLANRKSLGSPCHEEEGVGARAAF